MPRASSSRNEFRAYANCSAGEYIGRMRVLHALRMLHESDLSVTAIAQASGFSSLTSFERVFKKYGGGKPKQASLKIRSARKGG
ncbi:MAG: helix-turn-helix domain-containing protein [Aeromonadales bacterium]|nr:helix-turn-helix domain-containing protein [Aeromonadales bacterium]MDY2890240.1 helix-turn-helix domain-containing protein [Succinivibrio sp.]